MSFNVGTKKKHLKCNRSTPNLFVIILKNIINSSHYLLLKKCYSADV